MTGYGVPDDDMPDSFPPPTWGPPFDERDLDALLSGHLAEPPLALRQVADALTALRAAPAPAELTGEAAARAEFRAAAESLTFARDEAARTDGQPYAELLSALALDGAGRPPARHRSVRGARSGPGRSARPGRGRPPGRRLGRRGGVLLSAAGVAVIVAIVALAVSLPGSVHNTGNSTAAGKSSGASPSSSTGSQNLQAGSAARDPSHKATPPSQPASVTSSATASSSAQTQASDLCHTFYGYFVHPRPWPQWSAAVTTAYLAIAKQAGDPSDFDVNNYCGRYVQSMFPQGLPRIPAFLPGSLPGAQDGPANQGGAGDTGPGAGTMNGKPVNN